MSGGVDSAVAAALLVERGYDVVGITMKMYAPSRPAHAKSCCGIDDFDDARRSAAMLGIPHYVLDFEEVVHGAPSIERFVGDYARGRTPNPCVSCNNFVKLGTLAQYADRSDARYVATGHYARIERGERRRASLSAIRTPKIRPTRSRSSRRRSSTAFFFRWASSTRRRRARTRAVSDLPVHDKTESQDVCFVEGGGLPRGVGAAAPRDQRRRRGGRRAAASGSASTPASRNYTIGQRAKLPASSEGARYVTRIDAATNTIVVGREDELLSSELVADEVNLIRPERFAGDHAACER